MLQAGWLLLGAMTIGGALGARRSLRSYRLALGSLSALYLGLGAAANAVFLLAGSSYAHFAEASQFAFVRDTWESLVVPHERSFITVLVLFEATAGVLLLVGGRSRQVGLLLIAAFNVAVLAFSWWYAPWSVPMVVAVVLLLRAGPTWSAEVSPAPSSSRSAGPAATAHG
jgi:uncharacterized membrane protein YphA (DoxX/SURF4 family)